MRQLAIRRNVVDEAQKIGGFTFLEVIIAMMLFGFLMLYVSQLMNSQLRLYNTATQKNSLEQKVRAATAKIVDQVRYFPKTYYSYKQGQKPSLPTTTPSDAGVYSKDPITLVNSCLVDTDPNLSLINSTSYPKGIIYVDKSKNPWELRYKLNNEQSVLLADGIQSFSISPVTNSSGNDLIKIDITASNSKSDYRLVTWVGLYYGQ
ncbi:prepilin-type N-terminal cleavage/methylation domain-containing protein [Desulfosporosinus sp. Sb-LF]|uniref:PilW family protein n=1 Tax=Desulfosporosinus sp. Sb-LF TaxID=2560027 RepID=UPI00107F5CFE|nr:prepilin-type N-terminal cleavage/methylation domain-containing protein [Desulfosporosinus sp. Sb-LF]TGE34193.1 prepilin-type N-terminal cleavage/methylation domain-containing protein [Desulfosporosinus sp. Sb-LF]